MEIISNRLKAQRVMKRAGSVLGILSLMILTSCSSKQPISFNIHTEPEGAHIIYSIDDFDWTYLGITPIKAVKIMSEERLQDGQTFTLKAMRCGYVDQSRQWLGEDLFDENEDKGMILWTPRLIRSIE
ncbi:MAG: hypothetical protein GY702_03940 [Desulfobulbaceae bacterium]|nr:hypothetical protein [Desulfobulbaceae bacterium]